MISPNIDRINTIDGILPFIHEDAKIMTGGLERMVLSKKQYSESVPKGYWRKAPKLELKSPKMNVVGDEATVTVPFICLDSGQALMMFMKLVRENGKWYVMSNTY